MVEDEPIEAGSVRGFVAPAEVGAAAGAKGHLPEAFRRLAEVQGKVSGGEAAGSQGETADLPVDAVGGGHEMAVGAVDGDSQARQGDVRTAVGARHAVCIGQDRVVEHGFGSRASVFPFQGKRRIGRKKGEVLVHGTLPAGPLPGCGEASGRLAFLSKI